MKKILVIFCLSFFVTGCLLGVFFSWQAFWQRSRVGVESVSFFIETGEGARQIAYRLRTEHLISSRLFFNIYVWMTGVENRFQPGIFFLTKGMSYKQLVSLLTHPETAEVVITIPEGYTIAQIGNLLISKGLTTSDEWFAVVGDPAIDTRANPEGRMPKDFSKEFSFLSSKPLFVSLEGYLFPDTYRFLQTSTTEELVRKMLENFDRKFPEEWQKVIVSSGRSLHDVVTLASIVEREVHTEPDRALVADLFLRRLGVGMPLQADSTVNYVTGKKDPSISFADRDIDSLWNTYQYSGLPLGPISNPGAAALEAVVYPKANDAWYFLTDASGVVHYARTNQ